MGKIRFDIPFEVTSLYIAQVPVEGGMRHQVKEIKMRFLWRDVLGVEEFADHHLFPQHVDIPKCRLVTTRGVGTISYIVMVDYDELADNWSEYILWKDKLSFIAKSN